jgi:hypothetical protein
MVVTRVHYLEMENFERDIKYNFSIQEGKDINGKLFNQCINLLDKYKTIVTERSIELPKHILTDLEMFKLSTKDWNSDGDNYLSIHSIKNKHRRLSISRASYTRSSFSRSNSTPLQKSIPPSYKSNQQIENSNKLRKITKHANTKKIPFLKAVSVNSIISKSESLRSNDKAKHSNLKKLPFLKAVSVNSILSKSESLRSNDKAKHSNLKKLPFLKVFSVNSIISKSESLRSNEKEVTIVKKTGLLPTLKPSKEQKQVIGNQYVKSPNNLETTHGHFVNRNNSKTPKVILKTPWNFKLTENKKVDKLMNSLNSPRSSQSKYFTNNETELNQYKRIHAGKSGSKFDLYR